MNPILKKLHLQEKRFVTAEELKEYCSAYNLNTILPLEILPQEDIC